MAEHNPDAEGSDGPQAWPEPPEQTRDASGTGSQAAQRGHDRSRPRRGQIRSHPVVREQQAKRASELQLRIADWITAFAGSMRFVYIHVAVFTIWMVFIESRPWPTLTLVVSLEAIFLSTFVLIGQNRQSDFQQAKADHDFNEQELHFRAGLSAGSGNVVVPVRELASTYRVRRQASAWPRRGRPGNFGSGSGFLRCPRRWGVAGGSN